jgi:hypothetical protein
MHYLIFEAVFLSCMHYLIGLEEENWFQFFFVQGFSLIAPPGCKCIVLVLADVWTRTLNPFALVMWLITCVLDFRS